MAHQSVDDPSPVVGSGTGRSLRAELHRARGALVEAELALTPAERFEAAHRCARLIAAVVLAHRAPADVRAAARSRPTPVWLLLARTAPECGEWAAFFAFTERIGDPSPRLADDVMREVAAFLVQVESWRSDDQVGQSCDVGE